MPVETEMKILVKYCMRCELAYSKFQSTSLLNVY